MIAIILHEIAHAFIAYGRGYILDTITLMPYGAVLSGEDEFKDKDAVAIAIAGPIFSFFLAMLTVSLWWIFPKIYDATLYFFYTNIALTIFNLLPIYPLDGGRIVLAKIKDKKKGLAILKKVGLGCSFGLLGLFILSAFFTINYFLAIMAISLFISSAFTFKKNDYIHIINRTIGVKNTNSVLQNKVIFVSKDTKLIKILKELDNNSYLSIKVLDEELNTAMVIEENRLKDIFLKYNLDEKIGNVL